MYKDLNSKNKIAEISTKLSINIVISILIINNQSYLQLKMRTIKQSISYKITKRDVLHVNQ